MSAFQKQGTILLISHWGGGNSVELGFEWHQEKAKENLKKHGISFDEAKTIFNDPFSITITDPEHSLDQERYIDIGLSLRG